MKNVANFYSYIACFVAIIPAKTDIRDEAMITENDDSVDAVNELVRKISIKETQLKIA